MPETLESIELVEGSSLLAREWIWDLLHDPSALEWREKVGVPNPLDGSGKSTTRLLLSRGWVFKTDAHRRSATPASLADEMKKALRIAERVAPWHPAKLWFLLESQGSWWPLTACPRLISLRSLQDWQDKTNGWIQVLRLAFAINREHGLGLDLNPANFGISEDNGQLYYLDEELYEAHRPIDFAEFLVSRIPEEPKLPPEPWKEWGNSLQQALLTLLEDQAQWRELLDGLEDYPLPASFSAQKAALLRGLRENNPALGKPRPRPSAPRWTCVLSDVHANLPALEAVLAAAQLLGADSYLFLGDAVGYGPHPVECVRRLAELPNFQGIQGNHDHFAAGADMPDNLRSMARKSLVWTLTRLGEAERRWLSRLPLELAADGWLAVHGAPMDPSRIHGYVYEMTYQDNLDYLQQSPWRACFYGHTHVPFLHLRTQGQPDAKLWPRPVDILRPGESWLINPGSVGQPRDGDEKASFALWDRGKNRITFHRIGYPIEETIRAIHEHGLPADLAHRLEIGR